MTIDELIELADAYGQAQYHAGYEPNNVALAQHAIVARKSLMRAFAEFAATQQQIKARLDFIHEYLNTIRKQAD